MTPRPTIFISAVSRELKSARQLVANTLSFLGYEAVWQDIFGTEEGDLRAMLRSKIDECEGVVQLVGRRYGAEPPAPDEHFGRVSYTQYEALYGQQQGKKVWYLVMDENFPVDPVEPEPAELRELQAAYLRRLQADSHLYHPLKSPEALETSVLKLRNDLSRLRRGFKQWAAAVIVLLLVLVAAVIWIQNNERKTAQQLSSTARQLDIVTNQLAALLTKSGPPSPESAATRNDPAATAASLHPKLRFDVFGLAHGATNWVRLGPETPLRSGDDFFIRAESFTSGFLYVFQIDAAHKMQWLFPANPTFAYSHGTNPCPAPGATILPPSRDAYTLDDNIGEEYVYAIYSATRWEELEAALKNATGNATNAAQLEIGALLGAEEAIEERAKGIAREETAPVSKEVLAAADPAKTPFVVDFSGRSAEANGYWLLQVRRFPHLARIAPPETEKSATAH